MIGKIILHYKILEKLGEGGMGVVYLAEDLKLERKVAIKFLPRHIAGNSEERERFKIEAKAAAALNHPNIATIHAIEESGEDTFIVMEYIDGKELKSFVETGHAPSLRMNEIINYAIQIAEGLEAAHKKGIVHRDIKSQNIMITNDGKVKIMDFGLAKVGKDSQLTKLGSTVGTIAYMSPEQTQGETIDNRTDIWSFGVVLYEMVTGKMPFKGEYDQAIIYSILNEEPVSINEIDEGLKNIISKSLEKNPDNRFQTAKEITDELRAIKNGGVKVSNAKPSHLLWIGITLVILIIFASIYLFKLSRNNSITTNVIKTIAVLPFLDLSPQKNQEYFSDGLSEELINTLSQNNKLRVIARTSSFYFKGKDVDVKTIAAKLHVQHILEGSVQKYGNRLRISADLVNVTTNATLWSDIYNGTLNNIFALQDSISQSVVAALNITLLGDTVNQYKEKNSDAYNLFLLGNYFFEKRGKDNYEKAIDYYKKAISIDPKYAQAWVALSSVHGEQAMSELIPEDDGYSIARQEVEKALKLDPNLASAYSRLGWIKLNYDWDWVGANLLYKKALQLEPGNATIMSESSVLARTLGKLDEALSLIRKSTELNPVSIPAYKELGVITYYSGLYNQSKDAYKKVLELNSQIPAMHLFIGLDYLKEGKPDSALKELMKENISIMHMYGSAMVFYKEGKIKESDKMLNDLINVDQDNGAFQIAEVYAFCNNKDKAFEWLQRAYKQHDGGLTGLIGDPLLENIIKDPRYEALLKKMKLPL